MEYVYRCDEISCGEPYYTQFVVLRRTTNGMWVSFTAESKWKKFFYTSRLGWATGRHVFARPTKEEAYKDFLTSLPRRIADADFNLSKWKEQEKIASKVDWQGVPHLLFLPTSEQTAKTAYAIKMRLAVEVEADLENLCERMEPYEHIPGFMRVTLARGFVRQKSGTPYDTSKQFFPDRFIL